VEVLALVPARGRSKGLPRKNLQPMAGIPLVGHAILHGREAQSIDRVVVSTDDEEIAEVAREWGADVPFLRPAALSEDESPDIDAFAHALHWLGEHEGYRPDLVVQLRATAPLRRPELVDLAVARIQAHPEADSLRSVSLSAQSPYKMWSADPAGVLRPISPDATRDVLYDLPRQRLPPTYVQDGFIDIVRPATVEAGTMSGRRILAFFHGDPVVDIDDGEALRAAERIWLARREPPVPATAPPVGVMQGRLTPAPAGELQWVPRVGWEREWEHAAAVGLSHLELLVHRRRGLDDPWWQPDGIAAVRDLTERTGVGATVACVDVILERPLASPEVSAVVQDAAGRAAAAGARVLVLPLFEASAPFDDDQDALVLQIRRCVEVAAPFGLKVVVEVDLDPGAVHEVLGRVGDRRLGACYDTGNRGHAGERFEPALDLLGPHVGHVHVERQLAKRLEPGVVEPPSQGPEQSGVVAGEADGTRHGFGASRSNARRRASIALTRSGASPESSSCLEAEP